MWAIEYIVFGGYLGLCAVVDIRFRKLPILLLIAGTAAAVGLQLFKQQDWFLWGGGFLIGILFLVISKLTREGLGYGDSWLIIILGMALGVWQLLHLLMLSFLAAGSWAIGLIMIKRTARKGTMPFTPFLLAGYIGVLCL